MTSHSTTELALVATASIAIGAAIGSYLSTNIHITRQLHKLPSLFHFWEVPRLPHNHANSSSHLSEEIAPGIKASDIPPGFTIDDAFNTKLAIVIRSDALSEPSAVISHASRTVLGQFKKLWKRRDPVLRLWEAGGQRMEIRVASNEDVLMAVQLAARTRGVATHTFAGRGAEYGKSRSVTVVGPADKDVLATIVGRLSDL